MRRNSVRHFVHMVIDILPLLIIPIFALNILHKETEPISIEVQENKVVDFNQLLQVQQTQTNNGVTYTSNNGTYTLNGTASGTSALYFMQSVGTSYQILPEGHKFAVVGNTGTDNLYIQLFNDAIGEICGANTTTFVVPQFTNTTILRLRAKSGVQFNNTQITPMLFDLTQMYGVGNEPSYQQFRYDFYEDYYPYTRSQKIILPDYVTTYNDTDIGSQFVYALYKPVNDYFNFNNLFNMGAIYNWIELNLFSGTAPLPIFIIWNIIVYEFFVDLIFLLYAVFMFVIDFSTSMIDKFMYRSRRGI